MSKSQNKINRKKITIAEDNLGLLAPITYLLKNAEYLVESISDGTTIIDRIEKSVPDLLLLDVSMIGADGRDICEKLKKSLKYRHIHIILMSAFADIRKMAEKAGADDYISKPFDIKLLLSKVERCLKP